VKFLSLAFIPIIISFLTAASDAGTKLSPVYAKDLPLTFSYNGELLKSATFSELEKITAPVKVNFLEPHELIKKNMIGFKLNDLLKSIYGKKLTSGQKLKFTCLDGYQPVIPLDDVLSGSAYLAFSEENKKEFQIKKENKIIDVGPYYLVWSHNLTKEKLQLHLIQGHWPYQIKAIDLVP
jgi:hypothetical protein